MEEQKTFKDHTLTLTEDWRIEVIGPYFPADMRDRDRTFDALSDARSAINRAELEAVKEEAARDSANLNIRVIDPHGTAHIVTKINRKTGVMAGIPLDVKDVYPDVAWVREATLKLGAAVDEWNRLEKLLAPIRIRVQRAYGRIDIDELVSKISVLISDHKTAYDKAMETAKLTVVSSAS
jgi:hypothetical protein